MMRMQPWPCPTQGSPSSAATCTPPSRAATNDEADEIENLSIIAVIDEGEGEGEMEGEVEDKAEKKRAGLSGQDDVETRGYIQHTRVASAPTEEEKRRKPSASRESDMERIQCSSFKSVATSWLLSDPLQVIWRVTLSFGLMTTFIVALAEDKASVKYFSIDAYRVSIFTALLLLLPCALAVVSGDALNHVQFRLLWGCITSALMFALSFVSTVSVGYALAFTRDLEGTYGVDADYRHCIALLVWLGAELLIGATRVTVGNVVVASVCWMVYVCILVVSVNVGGGNSGGSDRYEVIAWVESFMSFGTLAGSGISTGILLINCLVVWMVVEVRARLAWLLCRRVYE